MPPPRGSEPGDRKGRAAKSKISSEDEAVADDSPQEPRPFDVAMIRSLVALMSRNDLSEIDLCEGDQRIRIRRGPRTVSVSAPPPTSAATALPSAPSTATPPAAAESPKPAKQLIEIKSQLVGTFYSASKPGAPPLVKVGDRVTNNTVVGIIEAMKIFNEITADCTGVIVEICVENQQPVEYEQVLFRVDPSA
jgi:acetyl-CoA carboxylase biotin carboxyl carrier protein